MPSGYNPSMNAPLTSPEEKGSQLLTSPGSPAQPYIPGSTQARESLEQPEDGEKNSKDFECNASSSDDSDDLMEQLMGSRGFAVETFSSLINSDQPTGFSYLDPDFDIGIPCIPSLERTQERWAGISERPNTEGLDQQERPASGLAHIRTCSDDEDCEVSKHLLV